MKSYTDIPQSKKLVKILPIDSADMSYLTDIIFGGKCRLLPKDDFACEDSSFNLPCWSLAALISILPKIHKLKPILDLEENSIQYSGIDLYIVADNPVDACYDMIIKLHELELL